MVFRKGDRVWISKGNFKGMEGKVVKRNIYTVSDDGKTLKKFPYLVDVDGAGNLAFKHSELKKCK